MITVKEYRGHIRNWEELCERLGIDLTLSREEREHERIRHGAMRWQTICMECLHLLCGMMKRRSCSV